MTLYVTFEGITYKNTKLFWHFNLDKDKATLAFKSEEKDIIFDKTKVIQSLKAGEFGPNMVFDDRSVEISGVTAFQKSYKMRYEKGEHAERKKYGRGKLKTKKLSHSPESDTRENYSANRTLIEPDINKLSGAPQESPSTSPTSSRGRFAKKLGITKDRKDATLAAKSSNYNVGTLFAKPSVDERKKLPSEPAKTQEEVYDPEVHQYDSIGIEQLILETGISEATWRLTLGVGKLDAMSQQNANKVSPVLRIMESFGLVAQRENTLELYPIKMQLTQSIKKLLNQIIQPAYSQWIDDKPIFIRRELYTFMQESIASLVKFSSFSCTFTELEANPSQFLTGTFHGNQLQLDFALRQFQQLRARLCMNSILGLVDKNHSLDLILPQMNKDFADELLEFYSLLDIGPSREEDFVFDTDEDINKIEQIRDTIEMVKQLRKIDPDFNQLMKESEQKKSSGTKKSINEVYEQSLQRINHGLQPVIIRALVSSFKCYLIAELDKADRVADLHDLLDEMTQHIIDIQGCLQKHDKIGCDLNALVKNPKQPIVNGFYSFRPWIEKYLSSKLSEDKKGEKYISQGIEQVALSIFTEIIRTLNSQFNNQELPKAFSLLVQQLPSTSHKAFYLCEDWAHGIVAQLDNLSISQLSKSPERPKVVNAYVQHAVKAITNYFYNKSEELVAADQPVAVDQPMTQPYLS